MNTTKEIYSITFGINSPEEIIKNSVCCINNTKKTGPGSIYDSRMGASLTSSLCETCNETPNVCPGHTGHIKLAMPIIHPLYYRVVEKILNCICFKCYKLMVTKDQLDLDNILCLQGLKRFDAIFEKIKKVSICCNNGCGCEKPKLKFSPINNTISMYHDVKKKVKDVSIVLKTKEIDTILSNISNEDVRLMGFKPELCHPKNYILSVLPVMPPVDRPFVQVNGNVWDDDITIQYIEIIKTNEQLIQLNEQDAPDTDPRRLKSITNLIFRVSTMFNNSQNKARHTTNGRPIKGIKERLAGKDGQIRNNMMGKRVNQTARTVIGPDPTLKSGQIAVPVFIAATLTVPVRVTPYNIDEVQTLVDSGLIETLHKDDDKDTCINIKRYRLGTRILIGDIIHRDNEKIKVIDNKQICLIGDRLERSGKFIDDIKPIDREYKLSFGMVVNRPLKNGDIVLLNRQPTLHKGSMMAMEVVIRDFKTIRMNLAVCKSFNADFDGDEMNLHAPQGIESQTELKYLSVAKHNIISAQSSKPNMAIVQDSLLGAFRMTKGVIPINKGRFFDISMHLDLKSPIMDRIQHIRHVLKDKGKQVQCFNGRGIISLFLPIDFEYEYKNDADPNEPVVRIHKGVLYEGALDKSTLGSSHISLITLINKEYGPDESMYFIDCIQFCTTQWLLTHGFTVGLGDCLIVDKNKEIEIQDTIKKCYIEADGIKTTTTHNGVREMRVNGALNKAKDIGLKIAKDSLDVNNNFMSTVTSGSKGDFFNIAQITGLLGQQNLRGNRVPLTMNHGRRSLPHYPFAKMTPEMEYESRGFIASSFIRGLNPRQFYFHAMSGREGITDTAMGTATSGYMQRRIVKLTEDIIAQYDGTVRDASGKIYQMSYGDDGLDPTKTTKVSGGQEVCNIDRLVNRLNQKHCKVT